MNSIISAIRIERREGQPGPPRYCLCVPEPKTDEDTPQKEAVWAVLIPDVTGVTPNTARKYMEFTMHLCEECYAEELRQSDLALVNDRAPRASMGGRKRA